MALPYGTTGSLRPTFALRTIIGPGCLTAVFGKGTGISSQVWAPGGACSHHPLGVAERGGAEDVLGWWKETAEASSEDEIKPIDWLVPVG